MSKEIIKENVVAAPTLFIGVGGTGCNIVKRVAEMCRPGEKENIKFTISASADAAGLPESITKYF